MEYREAVDYINNTKWFCQVPGLSRITPLLEQLGSPQDSLKFIHIAGTNGKGSCAAMAAAVMKACGYKTGLFTSPFLFRFNERMQINGKQIDDEVLARIVTEVRAFADKMEDRPSAFELMTAAALKWFAEENCDIVSLEVGMGGIYDATNVISDPEVSIIMNIGLDHMAVLGDTVEKIAAEKAGIIKPNGTCVLYQPEKKSVEELVRQRCAEQNARLVISDFSQIVPEFDSLEGQVFTYRGMPYAIPLLGAHQLKNAAVVLDAVSVLREKGWKLDQSDVEHGLYSVSWPGRFEVVSDDPWFVVDGGHNPQCAQTVADGLKNYFPDNYRVLLTGIVSDKDYRTQLEILSTVADEFICITPPTPRGLPAAELAAALEPYGKKITVCDSVRDGVSAALDAARERENAMVCAVGSLYSVGEIRACFDLH